MAEDSLLGFADKMSEVMPEITRGFARRQTDELCKGKITLPQFLILEFLNQHGESKMTATAHFMRVTTAAMTGIVDRLVGYGYVTRVYDPEDRRVIRIKLTARGSGLVKRITEQRRNMIIKIFGSISEEDRRVYLRVLMQMKDILTGDISDDKGPR